jgi:hypothetical protein
MTLFGEETGPQEFSGTKNIRRKRGIQCDRLKIRMSGKGWVHRKKKVLKMKGTIAIRMKR